MTNWQPIETAPKDGTNILVMYMHISTQCIFNAFWLEYDEQYPENEGWWSYVWSETGRTMLAGNQTPTHWMPLPEPPK